MEFAQDVVNLGDAPIVSVDGIASIEKISANKMRVNYFVTNRTRTGEAERRLVLSLDWDVSVWIDMFKMIGPHMSARFFPVLETSRADKPN